VIRSLALGATKMGLLGFITKRSPTKEALEMRIDSKALRRIHPREQR
jgi:hypothetical protein